MNRVGISAHLRDADGGAATSGPDRCPNLNGGRGGRDGEGGHVCECGCEARARRFVVKSASSEKPSTWKLRGCRNCHEGKRKTREARNFQRLVQRRQSQTL